MPEYPDFKGSSSRHSPIIKHPERTRSKIKRRAIGKRGRSALKGAQGKLKQFRQASILAVAITGFMIILFNPGEAGYSQDTLVAEPRSEIPDTVFIIEETPVEDLLNTVQETEKTPVISSDELGEATVDEALTTIQNLWEGFFSNLPKILVAIITLFLAFWLVKFIKYILQKTLRNWKSKEGIMALVAISTWLFAIGVAVSVVAGDIRALIGSLGLIGLALSWSLQTPIESFTGWLLNSFKLYYKIGDRIQVGDVFGDVYKIDFITTTVWEIGSPYRPGFVMAEQPTGRLVTFPNNEILSGSIVNLTKDFPYVWDELSFAVANESDLMFAMKIIEKTAKELLGEHLTAPAKQYEQILLKAGLTTGGSENPQLYVTAHESWVDIVVRYLAGASERRKWKSELTLSITAELNKKEYAEKIKSVYPRRQIQIIGPEGNAIAR